MLRIVVYSGFWILYFRNFGTVLWFLRDFVDREPASVAVTSWLAAVGLTAPPDRKALYTGYAFLYGVFGSLLGSNLGAVLYERMLKPAIGTAEAAGQARLFWSLFVVLDVVACVGLVVFHRKFGADNESTRRRATAVMGVVYGLIAFLGVAFLVLAFPAKPSRSRPPFRRRSSWRWEPTGSSSTAAGPDADPRNPLDRIEERRRARGARLRAWTHLPRGDRSKTPVSLGLTVARSCIGAVHIGLGARRTGTRPDGDARRLRSASGR